MTKRNERMVLSAFLMPAGYDLHSWRIEGSRAEEFGQLGVLADLARQFEAARFDSIFIADTLGSDYIRENDMAMGNPYEPLISLSALIAHTSNIGLIGTVSTTFTHPYNTARQLAALDLLSGGRTGWNIVTSSWGENAFGMEMPPREVRYRRAAEFVTVARALWSCWSDDAIIVDRATGRWVDPDKIRPVHHEGEFFKVDAYLNIPPSPQRHTVLVQAGQSAGGLALGAQHAEVIYTVQPEQAPAVAYYAEQKARVAAAGRDPDLVRILPGIIPYVGRTEAEAQALFEATVSKMDMEKLRASFEKHMKMDLGGLALDEPVPLERFAAAEAAQQGGSRLGAYRDYAMQKGRTLRDMLVNQSSAMGHILAVGTAEQVADLMIDWFEKRACDGFSVNAPSVPGSVDAICDLLIPELQRRGYAQTEYAASTLRGNLGLPNPPAWDRQ